MLTSSNIFRLLVAAAGFWATGLFVAGDPVPRTVNSRSAPEKNYRLFVGLNLKILHEKEFSTVSNYADFQAELGGLADAVVDVRTLNRTQLERMPKVARFLLNIGEIDTRRDYSIRHDSGRRWASQQATVQTSQAQSRLVGDIATRNNPSTPNSAGTSNTDTFYNPVSSPDDRIDAALNTEIQIQLDDEFYADDGKRVSQDKTALVIETTVSSPAPMMGVYVIGVARIEINDEQNDLILFQELKSLGPEPSQVRLRRESLPKELKVLEVALYLYRNGEELVSNLSEKQIGLTRDEAHEYVTLDHMATHRGATISASPAWSLAPAALLAAEDGSGFDYPVTVDIDDRGRVIGIDETTILPDAIRELVQEVVFVPALVDGQAVASKASFSLSDFFR